MASIKKNWLPLVFVFLLFSAGIVFALNQWNEGYKATKQTLSQPIKVTPAQTCKVVNNNSVNDYFVPTKSDAEWSAFVSHLPSGVSLQEPTWSPPQSSTCNGVSLSQNNECGYVNNTTGTACCSHYYTSCSDNDVYWFNACATREDKSQECGTDGYYSAKFCIGSDVYQTWSDYGCSGAACTLYTSNIFQTSCGVSGYSSSNYCYDNDVYRDYTTRGCSGGGCTSSTSKIKQTECGISGYVGGNYCYDGDVYRDYVTRSCAGSTCSATTSKIKQVECGQPGCIGSSCCVPESNPSFCARFNLQCSPPLHIERDNCGLWREADCGICPPGKTCAWEGGVRKCLCVPRTCAGLGCGTFSDGCGGTINCGACCVPRTCAGLGCGTHPDGCGGTINCGACPVCRWVPVHTFGPVNCRSTPLWDWTGGVCVCGSSPANAWRCTMGGPCSPGQWACQMGTYECRIW